MAKSLQGSLSPILLLARRYVAELGLSRLRASLRNIWDCVKGLQVFRCLQCLQPIFDKQSQLWRFWVYYSRTKNMPAKPWNLAAQIWRYQSWRNAQKLPWLSFWRSWQNRLISIWKLETQHPRFLQKAFDFSFHQHFWVLQFISRFQIRWWLNWIKVLGSSQTHGKAQINTDKILKSPQRIGWKRWNLKYARFLKQWLSRICKFVKWCDKKQF